MVVLCYKAGEAARDFVSQVKGALEETGVPWEIVLVGNYLPGEENLDPTPRVVRELAAADSRVRAVVREKEGMMGWDARSGLAAATGRFIALIDGDQQMPAEDLKRVWDAMRAAGADLGKTHRVLRGDGALRLVNSRVYNLLFRVLFPGFPVKDVNSKPKIFSRTLFEQMDLSADGWFLDAEMIIKARRYRARLVEIPTVFRECCDRKSFVRVAAIFEFLRELLKARLREFSAK
ncbi:MAG: glycosyltransferase family 2 protein [Deltaproteobacteria bacterium]|nr:glycosyltransferase family 2 protein [Deltaproteobacteria bacterium]